MKAKIDHKQSADLFDDAITTIGASDLSLESSDDVFFIGYLSSVKVFLDELSTYGMETDDIPVSILPKRTVLLYGAKNESSLFTINTIERLSITERERLKRLAVLGDGQHCRSVESTVLATGELTHDSPVFYRHEHSQNAWLPVGDHHYKPSGKQKKKTNFRTGKWSTATILESTIHPFPEWASVVEWSRRTLWSVSFRIGESPSLTISTDPVGVREMLRMRDVPDGKTRREALRHWVREHTRKNRRDDAVESQVRAHLRGSDKCHWFGIDCQITPSKIDVAKASGRVEEVYAPE